MSRLPDSMTLGEARQWLRERLVEGASCPCCTQLARLYRRPINSGMARSLIKMWRVGGLDWQHIPTSVGARSREEGKLRYWGLIEEEIEIRRDDGGRAGWWRVTNHGYDWIHGLTFVQKYAWIYDGGLRRLDGPLINIQQALGSKFDLRDLMR